VLTASTFLSSSDQQSAVEAMAFLKTRPEASKLIKKSKC
jgi:hypothetical protein